MYKRQVLAWVLFGFEWGMAALCVVLNAVDLKKYRVFSMIIYIIMGWCIIVAIKPIIRVMSLPGFLILLAGGISFTIGAVLYGLGKRKRYMHSVFHLFVLMGSILQFVSIVVYIPVSYTHLDVYKRQADTLQQRYMPLLP